MVKRWDVTLIDCDDTAALGRQPVRAKAQEIAFEINALPPSDRIADRERNGR
jgi:hypothetical protein